MKGLGLRILGAPLLCLLACLAANAQKLITTYAGTGIAGYSGDGGPAIFSALNFPRGVAVDAAGNLYVADTINDRVRKITAAGVISTYAGGSSYGPGDGGPAIYAQLSQPTGVALDPAGNLYIAENTGHRVRRVAPDGTITTVAGTGTAGFFGDGSVATLAKLNSPTGLAVDASGNLYIADTSNYRVRMVDTAGAISTIAGTGVSGSGGDNGPATAAQLYSPRAVAVDASRNVFIADYSTSAPGLYSAVRKIDPAGTISALISGDSYQGLGMDASGNLYACTTSGRVVQIVGTTVTIVAGSGTGADGGPASAAALNWPVALAFDAAGNMYIAERDNYKVRRVQQPTINNPAPSLTSIVPSAVYASGPAFTLRAYGANFVPGSTIRWNGTDRTTVFVSSSLLTTTVLATEIAVPGTAIVSVFNPTAGGGGGASASLLFRSIAAPLPPQNIILTIAGTGYSGYSGDGGPSLYTAIGNPQGIVFYSGGNLYVADSANNRVRKIAPDGTTTTVAGGGSSLGDGGPATVAQLNAPIGLALWGGDLYIADSGNQRIRRVSGGRISTVAGNGTTGFSGDGGAATAARLNAPYGIALDSAGNLYIADSANSRVRLVDTLGNINTVAGNGISGYFGDGGSATTTPLVSPRAVLIDATSGALYIGECDSSGDKGRVRRVSSGGLIYTIAGAGSGGDGGPAYDASLKPVNSLALDSTGSLYVGYGHPAGTGLSSGVRVIYAAGYITSLIGPATSGYGGDGGPPGTAVVNRPGGLALDAAGILYIADSGNNRIRRLAALSASPAPIIRALWPSAAIAGGQDFMLTVYGSNFVPASVVRWRGADRPTSFVSSSVLTATIRFYDIVDLGTAPVTVSSPTVLGGGGVSNALNFTVVAAPAASTDLVITIAGSGISGYSGDGGPALFTALSSPAGLVFDSGGNLYVADWGNKRVRKITPGGTVTTVAGGGSTLGDGGPATLAQLKAPLAVAVDALGNVYISDRDDNRVRLVTPTGTISTVVGNGVAGFAGDGGPALNARVRGPRGLALDSAGNLYIADTGNNRVRKMDATGNISTVAGTGLTGYFGDGGPASTTPLSRPTGVVLDTAGNLYIAENDSSGRVRKVAPDGTITTVAGNGSGPDGGPALGASLSYPYALAFDSSGSMYIACATDPSISFSNSVRKVTAGGIISTIAGSTVNGFTGDGGPSTAARLYAPLGLAVDAAGYLYIADAYNNRIRRIQPPSSNNPVPVLTWLSPASAPSGSSVTVNVYGSNFVPGAVVRWNGNDEPTTFVAANQLILSLSSSELAAAGTAQVTVFNPTAGGGGGTSNSLPFVIFDTLPALSATINTIAGTGACGFTGDGGPALNAQFWLPLGLAFDASGNLCVADAPGPRVRKIAPGGIITTYAGGGGADPGDGGAATNAYLHYPEAVATDNSGNLLIADSSGYRVRKVTPSGIISTVAGTGMAGYTGDGGPATSAQLHSPRGVAADSNGNSYIADTYNYRVRKVDTTGRITTYAGNGLAGYYGDGGSATNAPLTSPVAVLADALGNVYVGGGERVRKIFPDGTIVTIAGGGSGGDGGPAVAAYIGSVNALALDGLGNLYIASYDNRVRKVSPAGIITTVAGTGSSGYSGDGGPSTAAVLNNPSGLAFDAAGNLYIADAYNCRIRVVAGVGAAVCLYSVAPPNISLGAGASTGTIQVTTTSGCSWSATSNAAWLTITAGASGTGSGTISYSVGANSAVTPRTATVTLAGTGGVTVTISQAGANPLPAISSLSPPGVMPGSAAFALTLRGTNFLAGSTVKWNGAARTTTYVSVSELQAAIAAADVAAGGSAQVTVTNPPPGGGDSNPITFTIGCTFALSAAAASAPATGATGSVSVTAAASCAWTAAADPAATWISITSGASGTGNGTVNYSVAANSGAAPRSGVINIAGQVFTITQSGTCTYTLSATAISVGAAASTGSVTLTASASTCPWTATSNASWLSITSGASGAGSAPINYSIGENPSTASRDGTLTIAGLGFVITQAGAVGGLAATLTLGSAHGAPGGMAQAPIALSVASGTSLNGLAFGLSVAPSGAAPAIADALSFTGNPALPTPTLTDNGAAPNIISVSWLGITPGLSGNQALGMVAVRLPASALAGQSYTLHLTAASASAAGASVRLAAGPDAVLLVSQPYLVGDMFPPQSAAGDLNGDGKYDQAGEFGDGTVDNLDLIYALRAITDAPGYRPSWCSDLFDAIDSAPADTPTARGGDGVLDVLDLIATLRRVTNADPSRPTRATRGTACTAALHAGPATLAVRNSPAAARLEFGMAEHSKEGTQRLPLYLTAYQELDLAGLALSAGMAGSSAQLRFSAAGRPSPSLLDEAVPGVVSIAWLDGLQMAAGQRFLLGYIESPWPLPEDAPPQFFAASANARGSGKAVRLSLPDANRMPSSDTQQR